MTSTAWQAFYFHGSDNTHPPARTELIEASSEDEAAKVALSHIGNCKRVDIEALRWEPHHARVILAEDDRPGIDYVKIDSTLEWPAKPQGLVPK